MVRGCAIGIDPGERWVGVARAARGSSLALPVGTIDRRAAGSAVDGALKRMLGDEAVSDLIIGVPLRPDGREDAQAVAFREFGEALAAALGATCVAQNERFSSEGSDAAALDLGRGSAGGRKARAQGRRSVQRQRRERERSHAAAAARILQRWLDSRDGARARELADRRA